MGPGPPQKKNGKSRRQKERQRRGDRAADGKENPRALMTGNSTDTGVSSADTVLAPNSLHGVAATDQERDSSDGWNRRRYQREDEDLWGFDDMSDDGVEDGKYYTAVRNPSVNELHPPVVSSMPANRSETRWMLQPPPRAKIMEGKVQANRSRSESGGSNGSNRRGEPGLGRRLGERMMEGKRRRVQEGSPAMSRVATEESQTSSSTTAPGQRHDRHDQHLRLTKTSTESRSSTESSKQSPKPSSNVPLDDCPTLDAITPPNSMTGATGTKGVLAERPALPTIISSTAISPVIKGSSQSGKGSALLPRPALPPSTASTSSVRALQELTCPSAALNSPGRSGVPPASGHKMGVGRADAEEEEEVGIPEVETLWPGEFRFGSEGMEERRAQRWSMDI